MTGDHLLPPLLAPLEALQSLLERSGRPGMIIGGVAVILTGTPRLTGDVDGLSILEDADLPGFLEHAKACGLAVRRTDALAFARSHRVLLLRHPASGIGVDVSLGMLPFEEAAVARAREVLHGGRGFRIPIPEDLVIMKAVAHRAKDMEDVRGILAVHPRLDRAMVEKTVREFAEALEQPELWDDLAGIFGETPST